MEGNHILRRSVPTAKEAERCGGEQLQERPSRRGLGAGLELPNEASREQQLRHPRLVWRGTMLQPKPPAAIAHQSVRYLAGRQSGRGLRYLQR
eukprot:SAG11_NODE_5285_length_1606_cov_1.560053_1_plen_92_part_10